MRSIITPAIRYEAKKLYVLNQQKLPQIDEWIEIHSPEEMKEVIISLKVRGAPMIGLAALLSLAQIIENGASKAIILEKAHLLKTSRPTAVNLANYLNEVTSLLERGDSSHHILQKIEHIFEEDCLLCEKIAFHGSSLISSGESILTYCNTGSLATAGIGTALGIIKKAFWEGKKIHVYVCETRPLLQGGRLTAWELGQNHIPYTLICDNMAAQLMSLGKIQRVIVGADRIARNGDFANKIGTYSLAVLAHHHHIDFHVAAPYTTCDFDCLEGKNIVIEERLPDEVRGAFGGFGQVKWSPSDASVYNPSFDVTPFHLVKSFILNNGSFSPRDYQELFFRANCLISPNP